MNEETKNAIIRKATLTISDHGCLTFWLDLDYGNHGQGFGGVRLYSPAKSDKAGYHIYSILNVVDVPSWSDLTNKCIRVKIVDEIAKGIGHIIKDNWFFL